MKLYAVKCNGGYVRGSTIQGCACVTIEKASVFNENNMAGAYELIHAAVQNDIEGVQLVELAVIERNNSLPEDLLSNKLKEILHKKQASSEDRKKWEDILLEKLNLLGEEEFVGLAEQVRIKWRVAPE